MKKSDGIADFIAELVVTVIGWGICMTMLAGAYFIGYALAQHFGGAEHRDTFGLLSAITLIWLYEHRRNDERWTKFLERAHQQ